MSGCGHLYITADEAEAWVLDAVFFRLDSPELAAAINGRHDEPDADRWQQEADQAQAQLEELASAYGERAITMGEWRAARARAGRARGGARRADREAPKRRPKATRKGHPHDCP